MRAGRAEAAGVVRGWIEARALLRVELHAGPAVAAFRVRPIAAADDEWRFLGDDGVTECALRIRPGFIFEFDDIQHLRATPQGLAAIMIVYFGAVSPEDHGHVTLAVVTE